MSCSSSVMFESSVVVLLVLLEGMMGVPTGVAVLEVEPEKAVELGDLEVVLLAVVVVVVWVGVAVGVALAGVADTGVILFEIDAP